MINTDFKKNKGTSWLGEAENSGLRLGEKMAGDIYRKAIQKLHRKTFGKFEHDEVKVSKSYLTKVSIVFCVIIIIILLITNWFILGQYKYLQKEKNAKLFIRQIVNSVLADTDFYKMKTESNLIAKVEASHELMSNHYTISTIDYSWYIYEGTILFDNRISIKVDVTFRENKPYMLINWNEKKNR